MPMPPQARLHQALLRQAGKQREQSQHLPRPARVRFSVKTTGVGETRLAGTKFLNFGALMLDEPSFTWGVAAMEPLGQGQLPQCTAIVTSYKTNENGAFVGAEVAFRVDCAKSNVKLKFSLVFEAPTMRTTFGNAASTNAALDNAYTGVDADATVNTDDL